MGVLTLYSMYVERGTFMVALEKPEAGLVSIFSSLVPRPSQLFNAFLRVTLKSWEGLGTRLHF